MESRPKNLPDQVRDAIRVKHYARNTGQSAEPSHQTCVCRVIMKHSALYKWGMATY